MGLFLLSVFNFWFVSYFGFNGGGYIHTHSLKQTLD
jgi:hypothetical protein